MRRLEGRGAVVTGGGSGSARRAGSVLRAKAPPFSSLEL